jgi:spore germination cell wall hydrolase CwlJ-like protein
MTTDALSLPEFRLRLPERRAWLGLAMLALAASLYLFAGLSLASVDRLSGTSPDSGEYGLPPELAHVAPPKVDPLEFQPIAPKDALSINAAVPVATGPNPAARPWAVNFSSDTDRARALECLTAAVYYEAAIEPTEGQRAVAQVVLNRVRHPAYPRSVCGVVFQGSERTTGCQFSFTCDGSLRRTPMASAWARAKKVAEEALAGKIYAPVGLATHYHTNWVVPYWSSSLVKSANVGTHIFYRWAGGWGKPGAFRRAPLTTDPGMAAMRAKTPLQVTPEGTTIDDAAALAAQAADPDRVVTASVDSFQRAVLRRYEPMNQETATAKAIARTGEPASASLRWALGGQRDPAAPAAQLGAKAKPAAPAAAAPPSCLEGVRRLPESGQGKASPQTC